MDEKSGKAQGGDGTNLRVIDEVINIIVVIPAGTISMLADVEFRDDDDNKVKAQATFTARDIRRMNHDLHDNQEGYFMDHAELLGNDPDNQAIILQVPEGSISAELTLTVMDDDLTVHEERQHMMRRDIKNARAQFLRYIPDGDEYDAVYMLTDEGRAMLEAMGRNEG